MLSRDNLQAWTVLLTMAKTGNVTQTALQVDMEAPNVSKLIRGLESEMGFLIFKRNRRPFVLTPRGAELVAAIEPAVENMRKTIESFSTPADTLIRVAAPSDLNRLFINEQLMIFSEKHPEIQFDLTANASVSDILDEKVDVALIQRPASSVNLVTRSCIRAHCALLATPVYLTRFGEPKTPEDLAFHTGLLLRRPHAPVTSFLFREGKQSPMLKWRRSFFVDDQLSLRELALNHRGIAVDLPAQFVARELDEGRLVIVLDGWERQLWDLCVVTRRDREARSDILHEFAQWWSEKERADAHLRVEQGNAALKSARQKREQFLLQT